MKNEAKLFGRLEGRVIVKIKNKYYEVRKPKTTEKAKGLQEQILVCFDSEHKKKIVFRLKGEKLLRPYVEFVRAERKTGY